MKYAKFLPEPIAHMAVLISASRPSARRQFTLPDDGYGVSASDGVSVYARAFAGTHCVYARTYGWAELIWVACLHNTTVLILVNCPAGTARFNVSLV